MTTDLVIDIDEGVARIGIQRPPVNALTNAMLAELAASVERLAADTAVGAIVLTGHPGRSFCAGLDRSELTDADTIAAIGDTLSAALASIAHCDVPTVAAVNAPAVGAGMLLAAAVDTIVAFDQAVFALPEIKMGVIGGYGYLLGCLPRNEARRMFLGGYELSAERAYQLGMVQQLAPDPEQTVAEAMVLAKGIAPFTKPAPDLRPRRLFRHVESMETAASFDFERSDRGLS